MKLFIATFGPISRREATFIRICAAVKKYDNRRNGKSTRGQIKNRVSIDERPSVVDDKSRIGDTVIGKGHSGALVTIVERVMKYIGAGR